MSRHIRVSHLLVSSCISRSAGLCGEMLYVLWQQVTAVDMRCMRRAGWTFCDCWCVTVRISMFPMTTVRHRYTSPVVTATFRYYTSWSVQAPTGEPLTTLVVLPSITPPSAMPCACVWTPSPGWGPRGQGPSKNRQAPTKITTVHVKKSKKIKWQPCVFHGGWNRRLSHTHSYPGCHAPDRLVAALADHGCSQYTSIAAYDYS